MKKMSGATKKKTGYRCKNLNRTAEEALSSLFDGAVFPLGTGGGGGIEIANAFTRICRAQ
jgi:hypothetical protein